MSDVRNAAIAAALYFLVANPWTYALMQSILGNLVTVADANGPTQAGTLLHALVFGLLTYLIMKMLQPKRIVVTPAPGRLDT